MQFRELLRTNTTVRIAAIAAGTIIVTHLPWMLEDFLIAGTVAFLWPRGQKVPN